MRRPLGHILWKRLPVLRLHLDLTAWTDLDKARPFKVDRSCQTGLGGHWALWAATGDPLCEMRVLAQTKDQVVIAESGLAQNGDGEGVIGMDCAAIQFGSPGSASHCRSG